MHFSFFYIALLFLILGIIPITPQQLVPLPESIQENFQIKQEALHDKIYVSNISELHSAVHPSKVMSNLNA